GAAVGGPGPEGGTPRPRRGGKAQDGQGQSRRGNAGEDQEPPAGAPRRAEGGGGGPVAGTTWRPRHPGHAAEDLPAPASGRAGPGGHGPTAGRGARGAPEGRQGGGGDVRKAARCR